jgi:signal peptidase II
MEIKPRKQNEKGQAASDSRVLSFSRVDWPDATAHLLFWPVALLGLGLDLWTKKAVFAWLGDQPGGVAHIIDGFITLRIALNDGAAFNIAAGKQTLLVAVSVVALIVILAVFLAGGMKARIVQVALGLFAAGVCGNLWDRAFNDGLVRDFIDVVYWPGRHWPAFNVADSMLCIAVGLLVVATLFTDSSCRKHDPPRK